ncbi:uncharacterized protein LOC135926467 isoform X2 [Gordionus sp. m RMFG-2023]|uniref:uncharacterized protein LOC135926467 isoform X2 n=1 Tax=Gordionus sp. m RMFG-2023 TaxID=3053472 RepID=UPI0031FC7502
MPIITIPSKVFADSENLRCIYLKYDKLKTDNKGRCEVDIYNMPHYFNNDCIYKFLDPKMKIKIQNKLDEKLISVQFKNKNSMLRALKTLFKSSYSSQNPLIIFENKNKAIVGFKKWCDDYKNSEVKDSWRLNQCINQYMYKYEQQSQKEISEAELKRVNEQNTEEGWITVTSKSKNAKKFKSISRKKDFYLKKLKTKKDKRSHKSNLIFFRSNNLNENVYMIIIRAIRAETL